MSGILEKFKEALWSGTYPINSSTIIAYLVKMSSITSAHFRSVAGCTAATPGVVTLQASSAIANGDFVSLCNIGGITGASGKFKAAGASGSGGATPTFQLTDPVTGANVATTGTYTSGGRMSNLTTAQFMSHVDSGARIATSSAMASKTFTLGVFTFAAFTWTAVTTGNICDAVVLASTTPGSDATNPLILIDDGATGLPVTTNGGDVTYTPNVLGVAKL